MTGRDRQLAAMRHETTDRVPMDSLAIENAEAVAPLLGVRPEEVRDALGLDGVIVSPPYTGDVAENHTEWGTPNTGDYGSGRAAPLSAAETVAQVEAFAAPDPDRYDYADAAQQAAELSPRLCVRGPYWRPLFCRVCDLFGMETAMQHMALAPELFEAALDTVFATTLAQCERLLDACGDAMPVLCLGDDFASQRGMMISPALWRRFLKPRYAQLFETGKRRGKFVWFHSCGDITAVLPDLIDIGMDVWETVQLHTLPMSPEELKREFGAHVTFFGAINTQHLPFATPDGVRAEVRRCIAALGPNGGYICGPDHHIKPDVPPENVVALFEEAKRSLPA